MRPLQDIILNNQPTNVDQTSKVIDLRQIVCFSVQAIGSAGSLAGTVQVQVTNDPCLCPFQNYSPTNWTNLGSPLTFAQATDASNQLIPKTDSCYVAMRVVFSDTSSGSNTASLSIELAALGL